MRKESFNIKNINYTNNTDLKEIMTKCLYIMKLDLLLKQGLITKEVYEKVKKNFKNSLAVEKLTEICYNLSEISIMTQLKRRAMWLLLK